MTFEAISGTLDEEQQVIPEFMRATQLQELPEGQWCYASSEAFWMDHNGKLWIDAGSVQFPAPEDEAEMQELIIVLKIPGGFAVDISYAREEYTLDKTGGIKLAARSEPPYACEGFTVVKAPGVALIASELDRQRFRAQVKQRYGFEHPEIDISQFQR